MNKPYLLTRKSCGKTGRLLSKELGLLRKYEVEDYAPTVRWGNSDNPFPEEVGLNYPEAISIAANKLKFSSLLTQEDVPHVELLRGYPVKYPVVVREKLTGSKGEGIVICENEEQFITYREKYWTYWVNFKKEYGVHVLGGTIVKLFEKELEIGEEEEQFPIKNMDKGYHFALKNHVGFFPKLHTYVSKIYEATGIEMARFDIGFDSDTGQYLVIEGNTAPGLSENDNTRELYVKFMKGVIDARI